MPLLAYNLTTSPLTLAVAGKILPASKITGTRSVPVNVTGELQSLTAAQYRQVQAQINAGQLELSWTSAPEFSTPSLNPKTPSVTPAKDYWEIVPVSVLSPNRNFASQCALADGRAIFVGGRPTGGVQSTSNLAAAASIGDMAITVTDLLPFNYDPTDLPISAAMNLDLSTGKGSEDILILSVDTVNNKLNLANPLVHNYAVGVSVGFPRNKEALASTELWDGQKFVPGPVIPAIGPGGTANITVPYTSNATTLTVDDATPFPTTGYPYPVEIYNSGPGTTFFASVALVTNCNPATKVLTIQWALSGTPSPVGGIIAGTKIRVSARRPGCGVVRLQDGRILIFGGGTAGLGYGGVPNCFHASAFIWDPVANTVTQTGSLPVGWFTWNGQEAGGIVLDDGRVFICGNPTSDKATNTGDTCPPTDEGYLFTPSTGVWAKTYDGVTANKKMTAVRNYHSMVKQKDGKVLILGGSPAFFPDINAPFLATIEVFDPTAGTFTAKSSMANIPGISSDESKRCWLNTEMTVDGRVVVQGGFWRTATDYSQNPAGTSGIAQKPNVRVSKNTAIYDPTGDTWTARAPSLIANGHGRLVRLDADRILKLPGVNESGLDDARVEIYSITDNAWTQAAKMPSRGKGNVSTTLSAQASAGASALVLTSVADYIAQGDVSYTPASGTLRIGNETFDMAGVAINTSTKTVTLGNAQVLVGTYPAGTPVYFQPTTEVFDIPMLSSGHRARSVKLADGTILYRHGGNNVKVWPNSTLAANVAAGASQIQVADASKFATDFFGHQRLSVSTAGGVAETPALVDIDLTNNILKIDPPLANAHTAGDLVRVIQNNRVGLRYHP